MFRYAICNETFQDWPFERAFAFAREAGYTGLEIAPFTLARYATDVSPQRRGEVRRQIDGRAGNGRAALVARQNRGLYLTSPEKAVRLSTADYLADLARLCRDLGGSIMVLGSPQQRNLLPGVTKPQGDAICRRCHHDGAADIGRMRRDAGRRAAWPERRVIFCSRPPRGANCSSWSARRRCACTWIAKPCPASRSRSPKSSRPTAI